MFFRSEAPSTTAPLSVPTEAVNVHVASVQEAKNASVTASSSVTSRSRDLRDSKPPKPEVAPKPSVPPPVRRDQQQPQQSRLSQQSLQSQQSQQSLQSQQSRQQQSQQKMRVRETDGYVGFASLPDQLYRRAVRRGFHFTLMVVGQSGLGKSTLVNSMFMTDIYNSEHPGPSHRVKKTVSVDKTVVQLKENGVNLTLTLVDTPGFGDAVDNSNCWQPVTEYIESRCQEHLNAESRVQRGSSAGRRGADGRVHCCLYFIAPSGHGLKPLDVEVMKRLHDKVNIIPVLAKSDTMTQDEISRFKKQIMNEIVQQKIRIYQFPDGGVDEEERRTQKALRERVPFAIIGANTVIEAAGRRVRARRYPWGIVDVENTEYSDFIPLKNLLIRTHLLDLIEVTDSVHYENYRSRILAGISSDGKPSRITNKNPLTQMEEERREHQAKMKKMEEEMEQVFEMKVREKESRLQESREDLERREQEMSAALETERKRLEEQRVAFLKERTDWEQRNNVTISELRRRETAETSSRETVNGKKKKRGLF